MATWTVDAGAYADSLEDRAGRTTDAEGIRSQIAAFRKAELTGRTASGHRYLLPGARREAAWMRLHTLEEEVARLYLDDSVVEEEAKDHVDRELPPAQKRIWNKKLTDSRLGAGAREVAVDALHAAHEAATARLRTAHAWRTATMSLSALLVVLAGGAVLAQSRLGKDTFVPSPDGVEMPAWTLLLVVMVAGVVGATLTSLLTIYALGRRAPKDIRWFDPRPAQVTVKLATGLWTAVLLVWLVGGGLVTGTYTSLTSVLIIAVIGGFAQESVTHLLDKVADTLVVREVDDGSADKGKA